MMDVEEVTSMSKKESDLQFQFHSIVGRGGMKGLIELLFIINGPIFSFRKLASTMIYLSASSALFFMRRARKGLP